MRNLRNIRCDFWDPTLELPDSPAVATCWDPEKNEVICAHVETSGNIWILRVKETSAECEHRIVGSWSPKRPDDRIVSLHPTSDLITCVVLASGDIVTVEERGDGAHIETVGSMDEAVIAAAWSPDGELVALVAEKTVTLLSRSFDPVSEATMTANDLALSKHVSVGWGKKETQFQGRGAKALRDPTIPEKVDEGTISAKDDKSTTISWRGDGSYLAVNTIEPGGTTPRRVIRVYGRDGTLDSVSEPVDGLEGALSWRPAGNLMAGVQRLADRIDVVFFERNGLRHGQFTLRTGEPTAAGLEDTIKLSWNSDSTVLAVLMTDRVQLWTMGNYHWYLKQEVAVAGLSGLSWHPEKALKLSAASSSAVLLAEYISTIAGESCHSDGATGTVAVIDGRTLKLTSFRKANMPPPMALFEMEAESAIVDAAFGEKAVAILHRQGIDIYQLEAKPKLVCKVPIAAICEHEAFDSGFGATLRQICFSGPSALHVLLSHPRYGAQLYAVTFGAQEGDISAEMCPAELGGELALSNFKTGGGYLQRHSGAVSNLDDVVVSETSLRLPMFLPWFEVARAEGAEPAAFGLSRTGQLYAGKTQVAKNCSSFTTSPGHLIYTTTNHFVKFVHLGDGDDLQVPLDAPEDERCRRIERGSRLVTAMPDRMSLVLQMPRGNLETIYPRAMVLAGIRRHIDAKSYREAFLCSRAQRVDMNILYDLAPDQFLASIGLFLEQISNVTYIDLFLSCLKEEDVTQTTYKNTRRMAQQDAEQPVVERSKGSKINRVCDAMLQGLEKRRDTNLQNIITANVCKSPPALEGGLEIVAGLMREDESLAEKAVEHICFLVDVNRLYDTALGLYNLDLTLLVAQQSQRDPKEYLPFIKNLHTLPEVRRKFSIDNHLGRRQKALAHLKELDEFDELKAYAVKHSLYQEALKLYRYDEARTRTLTELYAAWLELQSKFKDAGLAYESLRNFGKATACYSAAGASCWRECLAAAYQQDPPLSDSALAELANTAADALWEAKDYSAAAQIHLDHLSSLEQSVACFCKGYHFAEAIRVITVRRRLDLLASAVDTGLGEAVGSTTEFLADCKSQLKAQVPRIMELRQKAIDDPLAFYEGERLGGGNIPDDISIAASSRIGTNASLFTRYTGKGLGKGGASSVGTGVSRATSKQRRKEEKKRARGRKGTVYEEEYLVNSVRRLVERVEASKGEAERLVAGLVRRDMAERARAIEALAAEVIDACMAAVTEVFGGLKEDMAPSPNTKKADAADAEPGGGDGIEVYRPVGGEAVWYDFMESRGKPLEAPLVTAFEKLSLLG